MRQRPLPHFNTTYLRDCCSADQSILYRNCSIELVAKPTAKKADFKMGGGNFVRPCAFFGALSLANSKKYISLFSGSITCSSDFSFHATANLPESCLHNRHVCIAKDTYNG